MRPPARRRGGAFRLGWPYISAAMHKSTLISMFDGLSEGPPRFRQFWWPLSGCSSGKIRLSAEWKPLNMAGSLHGANQYVPPIGVVRLWLKKAVDVK